MELRLHTIDRYGRAVAIVYVDGTDAGLEMLQQGYAWCFERYLPEASVDIKASYRQAQEKARDKHLGLWSEPDPPWEFRHQRRRSVSINGASARQLWKAKTGPDQAFNRVIIHLGSAKDATIYRGCHCVTLLLPPDHRLYKFDVRDWKETVIASFSVQKTVPPDLACVGTLWRIHPSIRDNRLRRYHEHGRRLN